MTPIPRLLLTLAILVAAFAAPVTFTGCANPEATQREKAITTHKDVWTLTKAAYDAWCERVVKPGSKVTANKEAQVDVAWNVFRAAFRESLVRLKNNETAPAPPDLQKLSTDLLRMVKTN